MGERCGSVRQYLRNVIHVYKKEGGRIPECGKCDQQGKYVVVQLYRELPLLRPRLEPGVFVLYTFTFYFKVYFHQLAPVVTCIVNIGHERTYYGLCF